ncbi:MAG: GAF domain-containing protein [Gammaproteobacteria bacterium]|nr:GAF domain-containing protein [Gammaproteobacteria bacterium]
MSHSRHLLEQIEKLTEIGTALSAERDTERLLETILLGAKRLTHADGGTLYSVQEDGTVKMEIVRTDSLNFAMGGTTGKAIPFAPIPLYDAAGQPNHHMVVTHAVLNDRTINIPDAYDADGFDFSGTKSFDASTGYRSTSFLTVPMKDHEGEIIGVLQLLNAQEENGGIIPFDDAAQKLAESLASQAAIALTNRRLIDDLKNLLESLIQLIATAIDEKSPYTGGHCKRVPELTMALAEAAHHAEGQFKAFRMSEDDRYELRMAAWLHDCGKITTPEAVVDKATKLETIYDRIEVVATRFELLKRDAEITLLRRQLECADEAQRLTARQQYERHADELEAELDFLRRCNSGGEFMSEAEQERVRQIGRRCWQQGGQQRPLLSDDELYNLTIQKGTLTPEEREVINNHIVATIKMLEALPFPKNLRHVPEFAGGHHEKMDGSGYPRGLTGEQMSLQARIMAIADIFEALTAKDRPYKEGKKLSEALRILGLMSEEHHIDPDLFRLFIQARIYQQYADSYLAPEQIDPIDINTLPGI